MRCSKATEGYKVNVIVQLKASAKKVMQLRKFSCCFKRTVFISTDLDYSPPKAQFEILACLQNSFD